MFKLNIDQFKKLSALLDKATLKKLEKLMQAIPSDMMAIIKDAAFAEGRSIDEEVTIRLLVTFIDPPQFGCSILFDSIRNNKVKKSQLKIEREALEQGWMYIYQMERLRLYLKFKSRLPKSYNEVFLLKDLKEKIKQIQEEMSDEQFEG